MAKEILYLTETQAVVKIVGSSPETIDIEEDLLSPTQVLGSSLDPDDPDYHPPLQGITPLSVGITCIQWAAANNVTIVRGGETIYDLPLTGTLDLSQGRSAADYGQKDQNITVTNNGGGTTILYLRKAGGYLSKVETEYFGQHDDVTKVGI